MSEQRHAEVLHYFSQLLDDDSARVIHDAMQTYAASTLGRDKSIADQMAELFKIAA